MYKHPTFYNLSCLIKLLHLSERKIELYECSAYIAGKISLGHFAHETSKIKKGI